MRLRSFITVLSCVLSVAPAFARPTRITETPHFLFFHDEARTVEVDTVQRSADAAYTRIKDLFGFAPTRRIPVYLYSNRQEFIRETGVNRADLVLGVASSSDEAIRLDASKIFEAPDRVIGHEVVHIFLYYQLGPAVSRIPLWMNEGLAQVAGGADGEAARARISQAVTDGRLIPLSSIRYEFPKGEDSGLAYDEAQDAVLALLDNRGGWPRMRSLLTEMKLAPTFSAAMQRSYGISERAWEREWIQRAKRNASYQFWMTVAEWVVPFMMFGALIWGIITVRRHRLKQIKDEEPIVEIAPPSWWKEDQWR